MKVYEGIWSDLEMGPQGDKEFPSYRIMVAAVTPEAALAAVGCPAWWWPDWFQESEDQGVIAIGMASPGTVFESVLEWSGATEHWVPVDEADQFCEALRRKGAIEQKKQMLVRINLLSSEIDANEEENKQMQAEIDSLYAKIDTEQIT